VPPSSVDGERRREGFGVRDVGPREGTGVLRAFNRYEIKYLLDPPMTAAVREELLGRMRLDRHDGGEGYGVWSVYYDTADLRFYWEKIEGLRFRRKLRIRTYGDPTAHGDDDQVFVEVKQRVNRVTQKRRAQLTYAQARLLCDGRVMPADLPDADRVFAEEVLDLVLRLDLKPIAMTGYQRDAFVGTDADLGLRVTLDHRIRGRDRDLNFTTANPENRYIVNPSWTVLEVKANERVPTWFTDLAARHNLDVRRISKYCQSVEAHGRAPRSVFHVHEGAEALPEKVTA
jgi:SPX domain protein involved in polyphosphate accumulation